MDDPLVPYVGLSARRKAEIDSEIERDAALDAKLRMMDAFITATPGSEIPLSDLILARKLAGCAAREPDGAYVGLQPQPELVRTPPPLPVSTYCVMLDETTGG